jgi:hypothetical protein
MANLQDVAQLATDRIAAVIARARPMARGVALLSSATGGLAYLVGCLVFRGGWRTGWFFVGLVLCAWPAWSLWRAFRRLSRAAALIPTTAARLQALTSDAQVRDALYELVDRADDSQSAPLIRLGKDLLRLRSAVGKHRGQLMDLFQTISAITTLPGLLAVGIVGSFGLLIFSVVAVLVGLAV